MSSRYLPKDLYSGLFRSDWEVYAIFLSLCSISAISMLGMQFRITRGQGFNIDKKNPAANNSFALVVIALYVNIILYLYSADLDIAWYNTQYLAMKAPTLLIHGSGIFASAIKALTPLGIVAAAALAAAMASGRSITSIALLPPTLFLFFFQVAACSRAGALAPAAFAAVWIALRPKQTAPAIAMGLVGAICWVSALEGRGHAGGFSQIPIIWARGVANVFSEKVNFYISNLFEGAFVMFEGHLRNAEYPEKYKILSFSPLPSFLDHFDQINVGSSTRISKSIPISGLTEAEKFGITWLALLMFFIFLSMRLANRVSSSLSRKYGIISASLHFFTAFAIISMGAYSIRASFKFLFIAILISSTIIYIERKRGGGGVGSPHKTVRPRQDIGTAESRKFAG